MDQDCERILFTEDQIRERVNSLAAEIRADYEGKRPLIVGILKGCVVFYADIIRAIGIPLELDFMSVSSYGTGTESTGQILIKKDMTADLNNRDVLIVEDIVDSGNTLFTLKGFLSHRGANSVKVVTLLNKPSRRKVPFEPDYKGFDIEDEFVIGYGMDYAEKYRNLPYIGILKRDIYEK